MRVISRSSHEAFTRCPRRFYYNYLYQGTGFEPPSQATYLQIGLAVHKGMEVMLTPGVDEEGLYDRAAAEAVKEWERLTLPHYTLALEERNQKVMDELAEGAALVEALVRGWFLTRYVEFTRLYEVLMVEKEVRVSLSASITLAARADAVVRERLTGAIYVLNHKTTQDKATSTADWTEQWQNSIQMWTEALAMESVLGEPVQGCLVEGFYKGYRKEGKHISPLIYGYRKATPDGQWMYQPTYTREKGWERFPVWEAEFPTGDGVRGWLALLSKDLISSHYYRSLPILKNHQVVEDWLAQVVRRETDVQYILEPHVAEKDRLSFFWQNWGKQCTFCPYEPVCRGRASMGDLISAGHLKEREDHHKMEGEGE